MTPEISQHQQVATAQSSPLPTFETVFATDASLLSQVVQNEMKIFLMGNVQLGIVFTLKTALSQCENLATKAWPQPENF
jgi:hypothetical protein